MMDATTTFQKYPAYKASGVEWLGEIPEHWEIIRFKNFFKLDKGLNITKENLQAAGIPTVNYGEIHSKYGFEVVPEKHELKCVSEDYIINSEKSLLKYGDFIFADTSEDIEGSGNFTYLNSNSLTFAGYHTIIARPRNVNSVRFIAYVFDSVTFRSQIRNNVKGVKVYSITNSILKNSNFWLPPLPEQTAIAAFLDDKTAKIDRAIAQKEKMIALLKERKQIIIQNAVTGKLRMDNGELRMDNSQLSTINYPLKMKDSGVEWIGEIPEGWEVRKGKWLFKKEERAVRKDDEIVTCFRDGQVTLRSNRRTEGFTNALKEHGYQGIRKGDLVIHAMDAFAGAIGVSDSDGKATPVYSACVPRISGVVNQYYYAYFLRNMALNNVILALAKGIRERSTDFRFNDFGELNIALPPLPEQTAIVAHIEAQSAKTDKAIALQEQQIAKLKELKATLIDSAVTGKIKV